MVSALPTARAITKGTRNECTPFGVVQRRFHETDFHSWSNNFPSGDVLHKKHKATTTITKVSMYSDTLQHSPGVIHQREWLLNCSKELSEMLLWLLVL